jgi:enoyl-CoA hydratase
VSEQADVAITTSVRDGIATVVLDRREKANALRMRDKRALADSLSSLASDRQIRAIVVTGAGPRSFCAGSDIAEMQGFGAPEMYAMLVAERAMYRAAIDCPKPVIAAVNGHALGAGMILAMSCDYAVASNSARFGTPELTIGVAAPLEAFLLPWIVGLGRARAMFFTGQAIEAEEASRVGLVQQVVTPADCVDRAVAVATRMAALPGAAFRIQKSLLSLLISSGDLESVIEASHYATATQFAEPATGEAMRAFLASRRS